MTHYTQDEIDFVRLLAGDSNSVRRRFGGAQTERFFDSEITQALTYEGDPYNAAALLWEITAGSNSLLALAFGVKTTDADAVERASSQALRLAEQLRKRAAELNTHGPTPEAVIWAWDWQSHLQEVLCSR